MILSAFSIHKLTHALQMSEAHLVSVLKTSPYGCASTLVVAIFLFQVFNSSAASRYDFKLAIAV